jgi:hypothetical protein
MNRCEKCNLLTVPHWHELPCHVQGTQAINTVLQARTNWHKNCINNKTPKAATAKRCLIPWGLLFYFGGRTYD